MTLQSVAITPCGTFALIGSSLGCIDMFNLQSGLHRQRFPPKLTPAQAKALQNGQSGGSGTAISARFGDATFSRGQGKHTKAVTGLMVDSVNRTVVSCGLDGKVKVSRHLMPLRLTILIDGSSSGTFPLENYHMRWTGPSPLLF